MKISIKFILFILIGNLAILQVISIIEYDGADKDWIELYKDL